MTNYGIWRISTAAGQQDQTRQILALKKAGATIIRGDKITGKSDFSQRTELSKTLKEMKSGEFPLSLSLTHQESLQILVLMAQLFLVIWVLQILV